MNYQNWYGNNGQYYMQNLQDMRDRIDNQMKQYQQNQMQMQQPQIPQINQNFQITPTTNNNNEIQAKYVNNIDDVKNTFVMTTGLFVNKEMNTLWFKNVNGDIRTFNLQEIIEQDEKDIEIQRLRNEIENMKGMIMNEPDNTNVNGEIANEKSSRVQNGKRSNAK
jgi:hypothetical protein